MKKEDLIRKLTSRKFWIAIIGFVTGILLYTGHSESDAGHVGELILSGASVIAYIIGEGLADAADASGDLNITMPSVPEIVSEISEIEDES